MDGIGQRSEIFSLVKLKRYSVTTPARERSRPAAATSSGVGACPIGRAVVGWARAAGCWRELGGGGPGPPALTQMGGASACASVRVAVKMGDLVKVYEKKRGF